MWRLVRGSGRRTGDSGPSPGNVWSAGPTVLSTRVPHCVTTPSMSPHSEACTPWFRSICSNTCEAPGGGAGQIFGYRCPLPRTLPPARGRCSLGIGGTAACWVQVGQVPGVGAGVELPASLRAPAQPAPCPRSAQAAAGSPLPTKEGRCKATWKREFKTPMAQGRSTKSSR